MILKLKTPIYICVGTVETTYDGEVSSDTYPCSGNPPSLNGLMYYCARHCMRRGFKLKDINQRYWLAKISLYREEPHYASLRPVKKRYDLYYGVLSYSMIESAGISDFLEADYISPSSACMFIGKEGSLYHTYSGKFTALNLPLGQHVTAWDAIKKAMVDRNNSLQNEI